MSSFGKIAGLSLLAAASVVATGANAATYEVEVTNLTKGQTFTPLLVVAHRPDVRLFEVGLPAPAELEALAESGAIAPLEAFLGTLPGVGDTNTNGGLLGPGQTVSIRIDAGGQFRLVSLAGMLIPTNDTFVGLNGLPVSPGRVARTVFANAYDAGTEANDQNCANIPGPLCGGQGSSDPADGDEGFVHVSNGFHDLGNQDPGMRILEPFGYDWRNPVARITVRRVGH